MDIPDRIAAWMLFILILVATIFLAGEGGMEASTLNARIDRIETRLDERLSSISGKYVDVRIVGGGVVEGGGKRK